MFTLTSFYLAKNKLDVVYYFIVMLMEFITNIDSLINSFLTNIGIYGPILGCFCILIESILPMLPLFVFITINFLTFGSILGFLISWVFTVLGCLMSFFLFRKKIKNWFDRKMKDNKQLKRVMVVVNHVKLEQLTAIIAVPFTPAFLVNIAAGLSKMSVKKFFIALCIGKVFLVLFWGFVGTSLIQSLTHPIAFVKVIVLVLIAFIVSKIINKKFELD